jgi:hypothetical protein
MKKIWCGKFFSPAAENFITNETQFRPCALPMELPRPKARGIPQVSATDTVAGVAMLFPVDDGIPPVAARAFTSPW